MHLTARWTTVTIWLIASAIAISACVMHMSAAQVDGEYVPMGNDSFYHARRILDAVRDPAAFYQFDAKIHAPEGSLLVWPWGYDYLMAQAVRLGLVTELSVDPIQILLWIPVAAIALAMGLLIMVARRLSLTSWPITLAALCLALNPTTRVLFGFGAIDHHYAELLFILAALVAGLTWFQAPSVKAGILLGAIFGASLAIHNGLFVLQLPFLVALAIRWQQGAAPPRRPSVALATSLLLCALAALIPSLPFRLGRFEFFTLSWFHLYIAFSTGSFVLLLAWLKPTRNNILALVALASLLLVPLVGALRLAQSFLSGNLGVLQVIQEMQSPVRLALAGKLEIVTYFYSFLIWLAPVTFVICVVQCWRERQQPRLLFWIASVCGLALMSTQLRMHYFGGFALYLPWLVLAQEYANRKTELRQSIFLMATLLLLLAYVPQIRYSLITPSPRAGDPSFERIHPMLLKLREICAKDPGVVLADDNAGHYIRYYTECSVISNNFLLTAQQFAKADEVRHLFSGPADELQRRAPYVKYVLVRAGDISRRPDGEFAYSFFGGDQVQQAAQTLLLAPQVPAQFRLLDKIDLRVSPASEQRIPYAKLYRVQNDAARTSDTSANEVSK
jgi:hypothetical protein